MEQQRQFATSSGEGLVISTLDSQSADLLDTPVTLEEAYGALVAIRKFVEREKETPKFLRKCFDDGDVSTRPRNSQLLVG